MTGTRPDVPGGRVRRRRGGFHMAKKAKGAKKKAAKKR